MKTVYFRVMIKQGEEEVKLITQMNTEVLAKSLARSGFQAENLQASSRHDSLGLTSF